MGFLKVLWLTRKKRDSEALLRSADRMIALPFTRCCSRSVFVGEGDRTLWGFHLSDRLTACFEAYVTAQYPPRKAIANHSISRDRFPTIGIPISNPMGITVAGCPKGLGKYLELVRRLVKSLN